MESVPVTPSESPIVIMPYSELEIDIYKNLKHKNFVYNIIFYLKEEAQVIFRK